MDSDESNVTPFGDAAERLSRREVLGRSGKFVAAAVAVAAFFKGTPAAFARNPSCGSFAGCCATDLSQTDTCAPASLAATMRRWTRRSATPISPLR